MADLAELIEKVKREDLDEWLTKNCGNGLPFFGEASSEEQMLHGLAYVLRQIEGTNRYMVHIGQTTAATSSLRMALDHFAMLALTAKQEASNG